MACKHPFVYPNGDCTECGVLATSFPGHVEGHHVMVNHPERILDFHQGGLDDKGRTLFEIQRWDDEQLEGCHDQIQWLFPVPERSRFNVKAPLLTPWVREAFQNNPVCGAAMSISFMRMMKFFGFEIEETPVYMGDNNIGYSVKITLADDKVPYWLNPYDHNLLRMTRIIRSLKLLGLGAESMALFKCLAGIYTREHFSKNPRLKPETFNWWVRAAYEENW